MDVRGVCMLSEILLVISASGMTRAVTQPTVNDVKSSSGQDRKPRDYQVGGPTLDSITEEKCPDGTYHKCLPYGMCYNFQSYCSDKSRSVNSCFPGHILGNNESLLVWCLEQITNNTTQRPHPACKLACVDKFGIAALYQCPPCQNVTQPTVDDVTSSSGQDRKPRNCQETSADYTWAICVITVLAIFLIPSVILNIVLLVRGYKTQRQQNRTQADYNQITSEDSDKDETEGPADPPAIDTIENYLNRNQPARNEGNVPFNFQPDSVQASSTTNTHSGAPTIPHDPAQGGSTNSQNGGPTMLTLTGQSAINIQSGQARYTQSRASVASARPGHDCDDTSAESSALTQRNQATESGDDNSPVQMPTESGDDNSPVQTPTDLSIHTSTTTPEADGRHPVVTIFE